MNSSAKLKSRLLFLLAFTCCTVNSWSQKNKSGSFIFQGVVYGCDNTSSKKNFKKNKQLQLSGVSLTVYNKDLPVYTETTDANGEFSIAIPLNGIFRLQLSKDGYEKNVLLINSKSIPKQKTNNDLSFIGAEFVLNSNTNNGTVTSPVLGILYYNSQKECFEFLASEKGSKRNDNSLDLIRKAVSKNNNFYSLANSSEKASPKFALPPTGIENITEEEIPLRRNEIEKSKAKLKEDKQHAKSKQDSLIIDAKESVIQAAEVELQNALKLIETQKSEIRYQKRGLYAILSFLLLLASSSVILYIYYRDKKQTNLLLEAQNRNIVDSITYAKRIQESILIDEEEIQKVLPDFFIYYQPKDIVSGDFYWFSNINGNLFIAVIDCTGHGVPGAFMSLIANTLLNEIVNEKHISDPALILKLLHKGIIEALHKGKDNSWSYDGMDMALCVIDKDRKKINYAGAMHPLYIVANNKVEVVKADMYSIGGRKLRSSTDNVRNFTSHTIEVTKGMNFYMFSDGYVDQFGTKEKNKFNTERFRQLLLNIRNVEMRKQKEIIQGTMQEWKGNSKQIDDMLVVGIKI